MPRVRSLAPVIACGALVIACSALALACSGSPPAPPRATPPPVAIVIDAGPPPDARPLDQDLPQLVERSLAMYRNLAAAFAASGPDCAAATARLGELATRDRDVVAANAKVLHDGRAAELRAALERQGAAFDESARAIMQSPTLASCAQDPAFAKAFDRVIEPPP
jgi:hypothetical protein